MTRSLPPWENCRGWTTSDPLRRRNSAARRNPTNQVPKRNHQPSEIGFQKPHNTIAMPEHFFFTPHFGNSERVAFGMAQDQESVGGQKGGERWFIEQSLCKRRGPFSDVLFAIRRVSENQVES